MRRRRLERDRDLHRVRGRSRRAADRRRGGRHGQRARSSLLVADARRSRRAARGAVVPPAGRRRAGRADAFDLGRPRLSGRRPRTCVPEGRGARELRQRDGRGRAGGTPAPGADGGHHRGVGAVPRDRLAPASPAPRRSPRARVPVGPRGQGPRHRPGSPGDADERARRDAPRRPRSRRSLLRAVRDRRVSRRRRRAAPLPRGHRRGRARDRHPAFRSDHGRRRDPGGVLDRPRTGHAAGGRPGHRARRRPAHPGRRDDVREPGAPPRGRGVPRRCGRSRRRRSDRARPPGR